MWRLRRLGRHRRVMLGLVAAACLAATVTVPAPGDVSSAAPGRPAQQPAPVQGRGSSYVAPAMGTWTAEAYANGLRVNYLSRNSIDGLTAYMQGQVDFAATEAEFSSLLGGVGRDSEVSRGFQYVPDVAGAVAIMYNVNDRAGRKVDYLRLSGETVARIFLGDITRWSDPAITNDLGGQIVLPDEAISVVYRAGDSGTTALFYDYVQNMAPGLFDQWVERNRYPRGVRIINPGTSPNFVPRGFPLQGSDQMASHVARNPWTITYDEYAFARLHNVNVAWIRNQSGNWVIPFPGNISAALDGAALRPDLSQDLRQVYRSGHPAAYPISAYSYLTTQCAPTGDRATCRGGYANGGVAETLSRWLRYIACEGQQTFNDAGNGYAPLPPHLSQEMWDSIARMNGDPIGQVERVNWGNCKNPRLDPAYRVPEPPQPPPLPPPPSDQGPDAGGPGDGENTNSTEAAAGADSTAADDAAAGREGGARAVGGGSGVTRGSDPVAFNRPGLGPIGAWAMVILLILLAAPLVAGPLLRRIKRT